MAANAGYVALVQVSSDNSTWYDVDLANDASADYMNDLLETTNFKNTVGTSADKERIDGLHDASFEVQAHYNGSDTNGQNKVRTAYINRSSLYFKFLPDGTHGFSCAVKVEKFSEKASVGGLSDFSASLKKTGALTAI